jgi:hypothetical protein
MQIYIDYESRLRFYRIYSDTSEVEKLCPLGLSDAALALIGGNKLVIRLLDFVILLNNAKSAEVRKFGETTILVT